MAYLSTSRVQEIRSKLKEQFPEIKFSVRNANKTALEVNILRSPYDFIPEEFRNKDCIDVNYYWLNQSGLNNQDVLQKIVDICMEGNHDNSDVMCDYFDVGWYFRLGIGQWGKPYEVKQ